MEHIEAQCVICLQDADEKIKFFNFDKLNRWNKILRARKFHNLKYNNVIFPIEPNEKDGYHPSCSKTFIALHKHYLNDVPDEPCASTSSEAQDNCLNNNDVSSDITSVDDELSESDLLTCLFCNKKNKYLNRKREKLVQCSFESFMKIKKNAEQTKNESILRKLIHSRQNDNFLYHHTCKYKYDKAVKASMEDPVITPTMEYKNNYKKAFTETIKLIECEVIEKKKPMLLSSVLRSFEDYLSELSINENTYSYHARYLENKIIQKLGAEIEIIIKFKVKIIVPISDNIIEDEIFQILEDKDIIQKAAVIIRKEIFNMQTQKIPAEGVTVDHILNGECSIPENLESFITTVTCSVNKRQTNLSKMTKIDAIAEDLIFTTSNGRIKPSKHITLGLKILSKANGRAVVDILNQYGHCCSHKILKEIETQLTPAEIKRLQLCPAGIPLVPSSSTEVAFNNSDKFVETASGEDTLHDTQGVIFQSMQLENLYNNEIPATTENNCTFDDTENSYTLEEDDTLIQATTEYSCTLEEDDTSIPATTENSCTLEEYDTSINTNVISTVNKKRKSSERISFDIAEYLKIPRMSEKLALIPDEVTDCTKTINFHSNFNLLWVISHAMRVENLPMWMEFNSWFNSDDTMLQKVWDITPINESPTSKEIVHHTLEQCVKIAEELRQKYIQVTYDLSIWQVARQILSSDKEKFQNIFCHMGGFDLDMAFKHAIGKFHEDCGITSIMVESGIIASSSVGRFISGKDYKICKRLYPITSLALQILHFKSFLKRKAIDVNIHMINELTNVIDEHNFDLINPNGSIGSIIKEYSKYIEDTEAGVYGKTPQFYMTYIKLIDYSLILSKSIRTSDFELYKYILPKINNLFFCMNNLNYARWLVQYTSDLCNVDNTHPGLKEEFEKGSFNVKRTHKPYSRQPNDITLKQTINADAGKRLTEISHFNNSIDCRQSWAKSKILISSIISHVNDSIGLIKKQNVLSDLELSKIKKNINTMNQFKTTLEKNMDPFDLNIQTDLLFNISSGKAAKNRTTQFLLSVEESGRKLREKFINECAINPDRLEQPIKKNQIFNFSSENIKKKIKVANKVQEIRMQRNLFGRLLDISLELDVDIKEVICFPITPVPMSLCHLDGKINKCQKSTLTECLEEELKIHMKKHEETIRLPDFSTVIIDGFDLLHQIVDAPKSFGNLAKIILQMVVRNKALRIDVIFDKYFSPSIKNIERELNDGFEAPYIISGPDQTRTTDFKKELQNSQFKDALVEFLISYWSSQEMRQIIGNKSIYVNHEKCYSYFCRDNEVIFNQEEELECPLHEEANTKMVHHVMKIRTPCNILLKCNDTDTLVIMLTNMSRQKTNSNIWMQIGTGNTSRYINVTKMKNVLTPSVCTALPGLHAFTGCDYNPAFFGRGKIKPFEAMIKSEKYQKAFSSFGDTPNQENFAIIEEFICDLYGISDAQKVNDARYIEFMKNYKPSDTKEKFKKIVKNIDASNLPPCRNELYQQYLRANYIASIWNNAYLKNPTTLEPDGNGWTMGTEKYEFVWFEGEQLPQLTKDVIIQPELDYDNDEHSYLSEDDLNDSDAD
ncbi:hypothetical protein HCN44_000296 [Aphidius gifuensis]|uniref:Uncharacterized protein n=1 Tax=Aphidius gifuensis TaxID=684658 RepID=A0A834XPF8_APHGI|nr:uncharacterized protein LOC122855121 [Aphidius gifuensis]KAF7990491.1 hypothetical protein HCN44_000296 [Aphidius gifuensis]